MLADIEEANFEINLDRDTIAVMICGSVLLGRSTTFFDLVDVDGESLEPDEEPEENGGGYIHPG